MFYKITQNKKYGYYDILNNVNLIEAYARKILIKLFKIYFEKQDLTQFERIVFLIFDVRPCF